ncbi:hypothetical protein EDC01DRAFT_633366 [Geopyxis carbonaria]|nr:hypothetical protein EDC01DRAFT_633366 [Geopyxis carbonaria]
MTTQSLNTNQTISEVSTSYAAALSSSNAKSQMSKTDSSPATPSNMPSTNGVSAESTRSSTPHLVPNGVETNSKTDENFSAQEMSRQSSPSVGALSNTRDDDASTNVTYPDDKSTTSQQEPTRASSFVPAAPPAVNPWKKRQEEQATKSVQSSASSTTSETAKLVPAVNKTGKKSASGGNVDEKKESDGSKETKEKKLTEEGSTKASKGSKRVPATEATPVESSPPPPVTDMVSWPTPDLAQGEFKREKEESHKEKEKPAPHSGGRGNSKWVPVVIETPYAPPIPTKSGRGRGRGGREGGGRGGHSQGGERSERSAANGINGEGDRGRPYNGSNTRGNYQNTRGAKRSSSAGGTIPRRESRAGMNGPTERKREPREGNEWKEGAENAATSQTDRPRRGSKDQNKLGEGDLYAGEPRQYPEGQERYHNYSKSDRNSQWGYGAGRGESESTGSYTPRERGSERGRGGYRGRNGYNTNGNHNGNYQGQNGTASPFPGNTNGHSYSHSHPRGGSFRSRGAQTFGNSSYRFNPAMQPPPFAQPYAAYDYNMVSPTAPPVDLSFLVQQINYYFSVENLCKDIYLRKHMDADGYVRLSFLIGFNRVQMHTKDIGVLRDACLQSQEVQLVAGMDDFYVRKRDGWENWVLKEDERDPSTRRDQINWPVNPHQRMAPNSTTPPGEMSASAEPFFPGNMSMGPSFFPQPLDNMYTNGFVPPQSGLSAAVPEFSPSAHQENGIHINTAVPPMASDELPDSEVDSLIVVVKRTPGDSAPASPEGSPTRRPNGVKDIGTITERLQSISTNGDGGNEERTSVNGPTHNRSHRSQTDISWFSSSAGGYTMDPAMTHRSYTEVRAQALRAREDLIYAKNNDLITLYKFWSHFLVKSYKGSMYKEFRQYALEDADMKVRFGVDELLKMYERSFQHRHSIGCDIIKDFVNLVRVEARHGEPLGIEKLQNILANPSLKDEYKRTIESLIDPELHGILTYGVGKKNDRSPAAEPYKVCD